MAAVLLFNYPEPEQKAWKFLLRKLPGVELIVVERIRFGLPLERLLTGETAPGLSYGAAFSQRMAVFAEAPGTILSLLIDVSNQVTREHAYRAVLTESNRTWTASELFSHLREEEAQLQAQIQ